MEFYAHIDSSAVTFRVALLFGCGVGVEQRTNISIVVLLDYIKSILTYPKLSELLVTITTGLNKLLVNLNELYIRKGITNENMGFF